MKYNNVEEIVNFKFPNGLNTEIKKSVLQMLDKINAKKGETCVYKYGNYEYKVPHFNRAIAAFTDLKMVSIWDELLNKSHKNTLSFATLLFEFEQLYLEGLLFLEEQKQIIQSYNKEIQLSEMLLEEHTKYT